MKDNKSLFSSWNIVKLGDVCDKMTNGSSAKQYDDKIGLPISRIETIWNGQFDFSRVKYIEENSEDFIEKYRLIDNDILFSHINSDIHLGKTALYKQAKFPPIIHGINLLLLRPNTSVNADFLNYQLKYLRARGVFISIAQKSVNQSSINQAKLKNVDITLAPIKEQVTIVSKLEELFSKLDNGVEGLKKLQQQLKVYRQAVLKWAFEGRLTNANVKDGELPEGWRIGTIGEVCTGVEYGSAAKSKEAGSIPVLRMGNIQNGRFDWSDLVYTDDEAEIKKYRLKKNDVLFNRTNSAELVGKTAIYKGERPAIFAGYLIRINRIDSLINADYLTYFLNSQTAKAHGNTVRSFGVNQSNINGTKLKEYPLPICSIDEQEKVVQEIESRLSVCDNIEETITNGLKEAEALRQSILKQAFEGKLNTY